jgi:hypothetical protein
MSYSEALAGANDDQDGESAVVQYFNKRINEIVAETADKIKVPISALESSFAEFRANVQIVPQINDLLSRSQMTPDDFATAFPGEKFRRKIAVIDSFILRTFVNQLLPLRNELANFRG